MWCGACSAALAAASLATSIARNHGDPHLGGLFNDFYDYWAAARILGQGGNPYDAHLVGQVLAAAGVHSTVGTGYSYPLLLAELVRPLAVLPPGAAGAVFTAGSLAALWLAVALLVSPLDRASTAEVAALATAAGLFTPVDGTLFFGQVNLYLLPFLALALRQVWLPAGLALASAVKLYPAATLLALAPRGRRALRPLLTTVALTAALAVAPNLLTGTWSYGQHVAGMFRPDPFWSNQSINGWLSRLALPSGSTQPPLPGLPVTAVMLAVCALLGALTAAVVAVRRGRSWDGAFALLLCYSVLAAPKNSLWNFTPLVVVIVSAWSLCRGRLGPLLALALAWVLIDGQAVANALGGLIAGHPAALTWLSSVPLYGGLLLFGLLAHQLLVAAPALEPGAPAMAEELAA